MNWKSIVWIDDIVAQLWRRRLYWNKEKIRHSRNTDFKHASMIFITRRGVAARINCSAIGKQGKRTKLASICNARFCACPVSPFFDKNFWTYVIREIR